MEYPRCSRSGCSAIPQWSVGVEGSEIEMQLSCNLDLAFMVIDQMLRADVPCPVAQVVRFDALEAATAGMR